MKLLQKAADIILNNGVIGYPTETVYGLGANALSDVAVEKVFNLKQRDKSKPILIIADHLTQVERLAAHLPDTAYRLAQVFWPGALTIVVKSKPGLSKHLLGNGNTIGIRIPNNKICLELLQHCGVPLTSTSANLAGAINPVNAQEVYEYFGSGLDLIIDGGTANSRLSSTVLDLSTEKPKLLREGIISKLELENIFGFKLNETGKN